MKDRLNIVLYVNGFLPSVGGREMVVYQLARALDEMGHRVRVLGPSGWIKHRKVKFDFPVHRWPTLRGLFKEEIGQLALALDLLLWKADVIHAHTTYPNGYVVSRIKRWCPLPLIITPHGADIQTIPEIEYGLRLDPIVRDKIDRAVRQADLLTAISRNIEEALLEAGAPQNRIRMIPNGVDGARFRGPPKTDIRAQYGLSEDSRIVLTVGNYEPRRGHENMVRAMPAVLEREPKATLMIVGRNTEVLTPLIQRLNLRNAVVLTGPVGPMPSSGVDHLADIYRSGEVYLSAGVASDAEGLSLAMLDGMAAGLAMVATDISGNRDLIENGVSGILVPPGSIEDLSQGITSALTNPNLHGKLVSNSKDIVSRYEWRAVASKYVEVYREALAENDREPH